MNWKFWTKECWQQFSSSDQKPATTGKKADAVKSAKSANGGATDKPADVVKYAKSATKADEDGAVGAIRVLLTELAVTFDKLPLPQQEQRLRNPAFVDSSPSRELALVNFNDDDVKRYSALKKMKFQAQVVDGRETPKVNRDGLCLVLFAVSIGDWAMAKRFADIGCELVMDSTNASVISRVTRDFLSVIGKYPAHRS